MIYNNNMKNVRKNDGIDKRIIQNKVMERCKCNLKSYKAKYVFPTPPQPMLRDHNLLLQFIKLIHNLLLQLHACCLIKEDGSSFCVACSYFLLPLCCFFSIFILFYQTFLNLCIPPLLLYVIFVLVVDGFIEPVMCVGYLLSFL